MRATLALGFALALFGCDQPSAGLDRAAQLNACDRTADGQVACFAKAFGVRKCGSMRVLGSAFKENVLTGHFNHWTGFAAPALCVAALRRAALKRGFVQSGNGNLELALKSGYREVVMLTTTDETQEAGVVWEREIK